MSMRSWGLGIAFSLAAPAVFGAAFDCTKAHSANEKLICSDPVLSADDDELSRAYLLAKTKSADKVRFKREAEAAWTQRESHCADKACLVAWYADRIDFYSAPDASPTASGPPLLTGGPKTPLARHSVIEISAQEMYAAYQSNELAADQKYKGKSVAVSGTVARVGRDVFGDPFIALVADASGYGYSTVDALFSKDGHDDLTKFKRGDQITVTCVGSGMAVINPTLDCSH